MKNKEKYIDIILNTDNDICNKFVEPVILKRFNKICSDVCCEQCHMLQSIWLEEEYKEHEVDWSKVKVDTPILVRDYETDSWKKRYFAKYKNGTVYAFSFGPTSWTSDSCSWNFAKLAEETEIEKEF